MEHFTTAQGLSVSPCGHMRRVITTCTDDMPSSVIGQDVTLDGVVVRVLEMCRVSDSVPANAVGLTICTS